MFATFDSAHSLAIFWVNVRRADSINEGVQKNMAPNRIQKPKYYGCTNLGDSFTSRIFTFARHGYFLPIRSK